MEDIKAYVESQFEYRGYPCIVLFMAGGYRCGYAGVPKGVTINTNDIFCHGGITYTESFVQDITNDNFWFVGFDCMHYYDGIDVESTFKYFGKDVSYLVAVHGDRFMTLEYCEQECRNIVDQIIGILQRPTDLS